MAEIQTKSPTQRENFMALRKVAEEHAPHLVAFINERIAKLDAKSARVDSKKIDGYRKIMDNIVAILTDSDKGMKCGEIAKALSAEMGEEISPNKALAMLVKMLPADEKHPNGTGEVVRIVEKKDIYFRLA